MFCSGKEISENIGGFISEKKQIRGSRVELTVRRIFALAGSGSIDFGGSEARSLRKNEIPAKKRTIEERYGWWELTQGRYIVEYNEGFVVPGGMCVFLQPLDRALDAGILHPSLFYDEGEQISTITLSIGSAGVAIKENARISSIAAYKVDKSHL